MITTSIALVVLIAQWVVGRFLSEALLIFLSVAAVAGAIFVIHDLNPTGLEIGDRVAIAFLTVTALIIMWVSRMTTSDSIDRPVFFGIFRRNIYR